ncbi:OstA-like protein [Pedobacter arcticus]|uniref:OstA-like protein n=1 Tax=Pedobacter arcticus TaxID=752140 RepID=UPI0003707E69|nr:OstA-like protein [Pedobacter arcticus]
MRKYLLFLLIVSCSLVSLAQQVTRVELLQSESFIGLKRNGENTNKVIKPVFKQDNATLTCDSAYFYLTKNSFEAFGNVHINQADTVNIYSDNLNYDGNTKTAVLTNNVKLTDNQAVLTTNNLVYNLGTKIGQYQNGGKIVNGANTLTSQNGYYFTQNKDAFFRYNVEVKSPEVLIKSDTLKYNTISKIAYFFGPTNIYGKTDTLYTENGQYNTNTDQASFGKKNLYTQNSKSLKGDSLFYDGKQGYGRAVKNIVFMDTAQKIELRGDLGLYKKKDESITVTKNAYVIFLTEKDSVTQDSIWLTADTLQSKVLRKMDLYQLRENIRLALLQKTEKADSLKNVATEEEEIKVEQPPLKTEGLSADSATVDSTRTAFLKDSLLTRQKFLKDSVLNVKELQKKENERLREENKRPKFLNIPVVTRAPARPMLWPALKENGNKVGLVPESMKAIKLNPNFVPLDPDAGDTTKIRIVSAYRKVKIFKSDLQAKADSAFFSYGDSTMRIYQKPIIWAQGSQLSADTMYIQMKNKKMDNLDMIRNSIIVNTDKDSVKFNQIAGKLMKGYFKNEKLDVVFINGNAESIYFPKDSASSDGMMRSIASRMRINFDDDSVMSVTFIRKPEHTYYPLDKITEELKTLPNFNWKPKERPMSKLDILPSLVAKTVKKAEVKKPVAKPGEETKTADADKLPTEESPAYNDRVKKAAPAYEPPKKE